MSGPEKWANWDELDALRRGIDVERMTCQLCLQPSSRSVCDGCESTGGLFDDWRSDSDG